MVQPEVLEGRHQRGHVQGGRLQQQETKSRIQFTKSLRYYMSGYTKECEKHSVVEIFFNFQNMIYAKCTQSVRRVYVIATK